MSSKNHLYVLISHLSPSLLLAEGFHLLCSLLHLFLIVYFSSLIISHPLLLLSPSSYSIISSPLPAPSSPLTLTPLAHMTGDGVLRVNSTSGSDWERSELVLNRSPHLKFPFSFCPLFVPNSSSISFLKYLTCN